MIADSAYTGITGISLNSSDGDGATAGQLVLLRLDDVRDYSHTFASSRGHFGGDDTSDTIAKPDAKQANAIKPRVAPADLVHVIIDPDVPAGLPMLMAAMRRLQLQHPYATCEMNNNGENIIASYDIASLRHLIMLLIVHLTYRPLKISGTIPLASHNITRLTHCLMFDGSMVQM